jgi:archaemetzincin
LTLETIQDNLSFKSRLDVICRQTYASSMKRFLFSIVVFSALLVTLAMNFKPPSAAKRIRAIGPTKGLPKTLKKALDPGIDFKPIPIPRPGDWLAEHYESGQSFDDFVKCKPNQPDESRSKIYLQPLGRFPKGQIPLVERLKEYAAAYFGMQVEVLPCLALSDSITSRINPFTRNRQILTSDVLAILKKKVPADAFCVLAITMEDLYPDPSWNFVFGQASLREGVGVYSFARYDPAFYGKKRGKDYEKVLLRRSCKVLVHETGHMFGLMHCIYFKCVLNGSNHLKESDSRPVHLCPVCLRKLQYSIGFDVVNRYGNLFRFYKKVGFDNDAQWVANRLKRILGTEAARAIIEQKDKD